MPLLTYFFLGWVCLLGWGGRRFYGKFRCDLQGLAGVCPFFFSIFRYTCDDCAAYNRTAEESEKRASSFHAWDSACLKRLPEYVSREFPFILAHNTGIDTRLVDRQAADGLVSGTDFAGVAKRFRQVS